MDIRIGHLTSIRIRTQNMVESLVQGGHRGQPQQDDDQILLVDTEAVDRFKEHLQSSENNNKMVRL